MVKVTSERLPDAQVVLNIEVEPEAVEKANQRAYQSLANRINVPGFRRGRAPRYLVERMIGGPEVLRQEGLERLLPEVYRTAVEQTGVQPIDQPEFDVVSTEPLVVKATVSVQPEVELGDYRSIRRALVPVEVPYERINATLERLREDATTWEPVSRPARAGDRVSLDAVGTIGTAPTLFDPSGQPLLHTEGGEQIFNLEKADLEIDPTSETPVPGFHEQLVGMSPGAEKRFMLSLPADWPDEAQRSKTALVQATVHSVTEPKVPALDDEFARTIGTFESLDALREAIRQRFQAQLEYEADQAHQDALIQDVVERSTIALPPALIRREIERLERNFGRNLARQHLSLDQYMSLLSKTREDIHEELRPTAERNLRAFLVLDAVRRAEGIVVLPEEIEAEIANVAATIGDPAEAERVRQRLSRDPGSLEATIWERKVVARLRELAEQAGPADAEAAPSSDADSPAAAATDARQAEDATTPAATSPTEATPAGDAPASAAAPVGDAPASEAAPAGDAPTAQNVRESGPKPGDATAPG